MPKGGKTGAAFDRAWREPPRKMQPFGPGNPDFHGDGTCRPCRTDGTSDQETSSRGAGTSPSVARRIRCLALAVPVQHAQGDGPSIHVFRGAARDASPIAACSSAASQHALVLSRPSGSGRDEVGWADVLVVGEFCPDGLPYRTRFLELCGHARAVFSYQPARLFLHSFHLCGGKMELWVFDRSGIYSCEAFDMAQALGRFATVPLGYMLMDNVELGVGGLIKEDG
ncbi:hypothetical protein B0T26DRAFT_490662 [Lasiosphaeria miniovina]|uniref:Fungal-type protein kinase domain-containing protein n=1 Tax=Lasiosphaeria miniovina TaxID=1954250 RepID=A0AA40DKG0_9PEZI|nr:uncharacterized protein B0T26DRAFT_490662 [Lasiosphaeria miniovina]KAK0703113.1 hypothetical protein B0T26DRAFT_490662 [Lasiosphaeria miniovina]